MKRIALALFTLFLLLVSTARAAENYDPAALAKAIEPYLDDSTLFIVHVDMTRLDIAPVVEKVRGLLPAVVAQRGGDAALTAFDKEVAESKQWIADFTKAGGRDYYIVFSMSGFPDFPMYGVLPLKEGANAQALSKLLSGDEANKSGAHAEVAGNVIFWGRQASIDRLKTLKAQPHPNLVKAFEAAGDSAAQALFVPSADTRKVLIEMLPNPTGGPFEGTKEPIAKGVDWLAIGTTFAPSPSMNIVIQSPDEASAVALSTTLNKVVTFAKQMLDMEIQRAPEVAKFIGDTDALAKAFTLKVEGARLTAHLDGDQSMKLTGIILPAVAKARARASAAVSVNNMRQIMLACVIYADGHRGQFPPSLQALAKSQPELAGMFKHPQMPDKEMPFGYLRPTKAPAAYQVVVYEDWDQHPATLAVGFADGHVEMMAYDRFERLLEQSKARNEQGQ